MYVLLQLKLNICKGRQVRELLSAKQAYMYTTMPMSCSAHGVSALVGDRLAAAKN